MHHVARDIENVQGKLNNCTAPKPIRVRLTSDLAYLSHIFDVAQPAGWQVR